MRPQTVQYYNEIRQDTHSKYPKLTSHARLLDSQTAAMRHLAPIEEFTGKKQPETENFCPLPGNFSPFSGETIGAPENSRPKEETGLPPPAKSLGSCHLAI